MSVHPQQQSTSKPVTLLQLADMRAHGEPIAMLTCYDASFARLLDGCGVDCVLVGDSLGMVVQGHDSTLPVTVEHIEYHVRAVARGTQRAWLVADMPFGSYHSTPQSAFGNAVRLMQAGAQMVKIEGGAWLAPTIEFLVARGVPVCAHLGLTPQSVHALGGYRIQGRTDAAAEQLLRDALALQNAGASMLVLELIPAAVAERLTRELQIATIGIGAGAKCSGQVLVLHDMLDVFPGKKPRFVRNFMAGAPDIGTAVRTYVQAVKQRTFPAAEHEYS
ncbi:MAG TPA: 3-methyl-2-oxobutanoate hydroxymethyltransferase [Burkholderiaceae bacterium]|nr:3-methyl-2-oxobutanoate hydroxymethyltransferase [Burkholderiaceae bacterium]